MTHATNTLPPLPEPDDLGHEVRWAYTADSVLSIQADAYEAGRRAALAQSAQAPAREPLLKLLDYADDSDGCQYGTLSSSLVRDLVNQALAHAAPAQPAPVITFRGGDPETGDQGDMYVDGVRFEEQPAPSVEAVGAEVDAFLAEVRAELIRARTKFPGDRIMTIALAEEFGELCKAVLDESSANVRKEAVQTAVMACRVAVDGDGSVMEWRQQKGLDPINCSAVEALARGER